MKIIVVSDSHGNYRNLKRLMLMHSNADIVVHCGDTGNELDEVMREFPNITYYAVRGNCDFAVDRPTVLEFTAEGVRFFVTHGHMYNVKYGIGQLLDAVRENGADIALFGHTHIPCDEYLDGKRLFNPGSIGYEGSFGVIDVKDGQVLSNLSRLK